MLRQISLNEKGRQHHHLKREDNLLALYTRRELCKITSYGSLANNFGEFGPIRHDEKNSAAQINCLIKNNTEYIFSQSKSHGVSQRRFLLTLIKLAAGLFK